MNYFIIINLFVFYFLLWFITQGDNIVDAVMKRYDEVRYTDIPLKVSFQERFYFEVKYLRGFFHRRHNNKLIDSWRLWVSTPAIWGNKSVESVDYLYHLQRETKSFWREINEGWYHFNNIKYATTSGLREFKRFSNKK